MPIIMSSRPIGIDLFAGCGGLSLGFEQAGFDIKAAVEIDPVHCAVHEFNFPDCKMICKDIKQISGEQIRQIANLGDQDVDVVFGGAPCQGFSLIGKRSFDDPRNQLVKHFVRIVSEIRPKFCVFENVKGLTVGKHKKFLEDLIEELKVQGYSVRLPYKVLNAADYGVPQNRYRLFLLAARDDCSVPDYPSKIEGKITVGEAISDLPDADSFEELLCSDSVRCEWETKSKYARILRDLEKDASDYSYSRRVAKGYLTSSARTIHTPISIERFASTKPGTVEPKSRFLRLDPSGQSNTLRAGTDSARGAYTSPRPIHPSNARVITVREAARIHGYPDWFRFHVTKWHGFREIGNSVPPPLGRAVASEIIKALDVMPEKPSKVLVLSTQREKLLHFNMNEASKYYNVPSDVIAKRNRKENKDE